MTKTRSGLALGAALMLATLPTIGFAQTVESTPPGDASPMFVVDTPHFLAQVQSANQFEIQSSELALEKDQDEDIAELAQMIIADHTAAGERLEQRLAEAGIENTDASAELAPKHAKMLSQLEAADASDFRMLYLDMQNQAHMEAIALFRTYAGSGDNQALVGFARETLPALETHAAHVKALVMAAAE